MEIRFIIFKRIFILSIGHYTPWFEQYYFITFCEEWFTEDYKVEWAKMLWHS